MSLNYERLQKKQEDSGSFWTSYADLATVQSVLFLLLYAIATLRTSSVSLSKQIDLQRKEKELEQLAQQVQAYNVLREDYLKTGASPQEKEMYSNLLSQMKLLEESARKEKEEALKGAQESSAKERELNHYQEMVRNIINANVMAQKDIKKRDTIIAKKSQNIRSLKSEVREREQRIAENNAQISLINNKLEKSIAEVRYAYRSKENSKKKAEQEINKLKAASAKQIAELEGKNREIIQDLSRREMGFRREIRELQSKQQEALAQERKQFEQSLAQEKLSAAERISKERAYAAKVEQEKDAYNTQLKGLQSELASTQQAIQSNENKYKNTISQLASAKGGLERELAAIQKREADRRRLALEIRKNFQKAGINADINPHNGEVTIHFGQEYFDYGSSQMNEGMQNILKKAIPVYAKSLFSDQKLAERISNVEIIGFASPTFKGKYVDPRELSQEARTAVNYNMDLSYKRAKSIFEYVFDKSQMDYPHQKELLGLTKVSGLSYLRSKKATEGRLSDAQYCEKYDCNKSQKVIVKFNFQENTGAVND